MHFKNFIGIDISKGTFDLALIKNNDLGSLVSDAFTNDPKGIARLETFLRKQGVTKDETIFCMEHTGIYCRFLSLYLTENKYNVWLEMPVQIIRSLGIQRGKNDKIDAKRIAEYAYLRKDKVILWTPPREVLLQIQDLLSLRDRLIESRKMIKMPIKELKDCGHDTTAKLVEDMCKESIASLSKEINQLEKELDKLINDDTNLKKLYGLAKSIPGIGKITAMALLYYTNEFKLYQNAKQLACYCGVAPFSHQSGTSIRGKAKVSHFANKSLKKLLHMVAMSAIQTNKELYDYYKRKVDEGKNKMLVLNAIRNKILHRLCSVIKRGTPYQPEYQLA